MTPDRGTDPFDVVVVGAGFAGLSAATWLGRHRRRTLVLDGGPPRNAAVRASHGYLGFDGVPPAELLRRAREDLARYETVSIRSARAETARPGGGLIALVTDGADVVVTRRLIIATGAVDARPAMAGMDEHFGADVFTCPICDGFEARGRDAVVFGWSEPVAAFALTLLDWAASVTVVTLGRSFEGSTKQIDVLAGHGVEVVEEAAVELLGPRGALGGVRLASGEVIECDVAFLDLAVRCRAELAEMLGCAFDDEGYVAVDSSGETSVDGVYAAGDLTPGPQLVQVAAASGAVAGIACAQSLRGEGGVRGAPEPGPDPAELERAG